MQMHMHIHIHKTQTETHLCDARNHNLQASLVLFVDELIAVDVQDTNQVRTARTSLLPQLWQLHATSAHNTQCNTY